MQAPRAREVAAWYDGVRVAIGRGKRTLNLHSLGEFGLIERLAKGLAAEGAQPRVGEVVLAVGDDAAVLRLPSESELVATIDALVEGVHFRRDWSRPEDLGWKALAVNVSDLGGMGARPVAALLTLALPEDTPVKWVDTLYRGLRECSAAYGCPVVGGDTVRSRSGVILSIAALGAVPTGKAVMRGGARVGDLVCVTGTLGDSGAGLALLERGEPVAKDLRGPVEWHVRPRPPVEAGAVLAEAGLASAMMDLSDGVASDLGHIARRSGVGVEVEVERLPISDAARQAAFLLGTDPARWALFGGEDYQLLFTVPPERFADVSPALGTLGVTATIVGRITRGGLTLITGDGRRVPLAPDGFHHF